MNFTVTPNENFNHIKLQQEAIDPVAIEELQAECTKLVKENPFIIFNCKDITSIDKTQEQFFVSVNALAKKANGSIILTELQDDIAEKMEVAEINCVPTDDEAVDFIFMEQIENQFMDEDGEEEEFE